MSNTPNFRRATVCLPLPLAARLGRLRDLSGVEGARPSESALLVALLRRGLESFERENGLA
jgi:hypothetical protein